MADTETTRRLVTQFWAAMQASDWAAAAALFADDYVLHWAQSGERIRGAANFVPINHAYPAVGRWRFRHVSVRSLDAIIPARLSPLIAEAAMVAIARGAR